MDFRGQLTTVEAVRAYLLGGSATVTVVSRRTGTRFTYKVQAPVDKATGKRDPQATVLGPLFVKLLTDPDNVSGYTYLGMLKRSAGSDWQFLLTRASKATDTAPSVVAFRYLLTQVATGATVVRGVDVYHEGSCGRCGRTLTVPESVASGFGPECREKLGLDTPDLRPEPVAPIAQTEGEISAAVNSDRPTPGEVAADRQANAGVQAPWQDDAPAATLRANAAVPVGVPVPCATATCTHPSILDCSLAMGPGPEVTRARRRRQPRPSRQQVADALAGYAALGARP